MASVREMEAIMSFVNKEANEDIKGWIRKASEEQNKQLCMFAGMCKDAFGLPVNLKEIFFAINNPKDLAKLAMQKQLKSNTKTRTTTTRRTNTSTRVTRANQTWRQQEEMRLHMETHQRFIDEQNRQVNQYIFDQQNHQAMFGF